MLIVLLLAIANCAILVPPSLKVEHMSIRTGELTSIPYPDFPFANIIRKSISQVQNGEEFQSSECSEQVGYIEFTSLNDFLVPNRTPTKELIFDFDDIKLREGVIDSTIFNNKLYVAMENAKLIVMKYESGSLSLYQTLKFPSVERLNSIGHFVNASIENNRSELLFLNSVAGYIIQDDSILSISNYNISDNESPVQAAYATNLFSNYLAVGRLYQGVIILEYRNHSIISNVSLDNQFFKKQMLYVVDIEFQSSSNILYVLDYSSGMQTVQLALRQNKVNATLQSTGIVEPNCNHILVTNQSVYLTCRNIYKINGKNTTVLPNPGFTVRQLYAYDKYLFIIGDYHIRTYIGDRMLETSSFKNEVEKFFLFDRQYIAVNSKNIEYGKYTYSHPEVQCLLNESKGTIDMVIKTEADCNPDYLKIINTDVKYKTNDICLYSTTIQLQIWEPEQVNTKMFKIIFVLILLGFLALLGWWSYTKKGVSKLERDLAGYLNLQKQDKNYNVMVEEKEQNKADIDFKVEDPKNFDVNLEMQHHSIE